MATPFKLKVYIELDVPHYFAEDFETAKLNFEENLRSKFSANNIVKIDIREDDDGI